MKFDHASAATPMLSSTKWKASTLTTNTNSGLNHTACPLAVYASQDGSLRRHARLASGWLASLVRAGITTRWVLPKGFRLSILLPQASPGSPKFEYQKGPRRIVKIRYPTSGENRPSSFSARINASMHSAKSTGLGGSNPVCSSSQSAICGYPCIADEESRVHGRFCTRTGTGDAPGLSAPGIFRWFLSAGR